MEGRVSSDWPSLSRQFWTHFASCRSLCRRRAGELAPFIGSRPSRPSLFFEQPVHLQPPSSFVRLCDSIFLTALTTIRAPLQLLKGTPPSIEPFRALTPTFNRNPTAVATCAMGDFENYGGSDEENAEVKRLQDELVSLASTSFKTVSSLLIHLILSRKRTRIISRSGRS